MASPSPYASAQDACLSLCSGFFKVFRDPKRVPRIRENYHRVPKIRGNRVPRIREIGSLQVETGYLTFFKKKRLCLLIYSINITAHILIGFKDSVFEISERKRVFTKAY